MYWSILFSRVLHFASALATEYRREICVCLTCFKIISSLAALALEEQPSGKLTLPLKYMDFISG